MSPIAAYASAPQPLQPVAPIVRRSGGQPQIEAGQSQSEASDVHSHGELASACPTCGHSLNLSV